jgi:hypothetical protein
MYKRGVPHTDYLRRKTADALWTLALVLRSQSDMRDGGANLLRTALKRMNKAVGIYELVSTDDAQVGRIHVQIAELYIDLAEIHLQRRADESARHMRLEALNHAQTAVDFLKYTDNAAGKTLPELTLLRHSITQRADRAAVLELHEFEAELLRLERVGAQIHDEILSAKAATLRGEWLLWLGDPDPARAALLLALVGFQSNGMGMATRAQRLLRRANDPIPPDTHRRASGGSAASSALDDDQQQ